MTKYSAMPRFPPPKINDSRPSLTPTRANFITGDLAGLYQLSDSLYTYVSARSSQTVATLRDAVMKTVKDDNEVGGYQKDSHGEWIGDTAYAFRDSFISDAAMMNGLNITICRVAATVDDLAVGLAEQESRLEVQLENILSRVCKTTFSLNWLVAGGTGTSPDFALTSQGQAAITASAGPEGPGNAVQMANAIGVRYFKAAHDLRQKAASELAGYGKILEDAFNYYNTYSAGAGSPTTMDASVLLTSGQAGADAVAVNDLQTKYSHLVAELNKRSLDENSVKSALAGLGVDAQKAGKILSGIKDVHDAKGTVATGTKFLSLVGDALPILMAIGMSA